MFIEQRTLESFKHDLQGRELCKKTETIYLFEGQTPNEKNCSLATQAYYKKLYKLQEEKTLEEERPVSILEILFPLDTTSIPAPTK